MQRKRGMHPCQAKQGIIKIGAKILIIYTILIPNYAMTLSK